MTDPGACTTCRTNGRAGSCARLRCYCGHNTCPAFDSWAPLDRPATRTITPTKTNTTWADRQDATWIDKL